MESNKFNNSLYNLCHNMIVELLGFVIHFQTRTKVKSQFCKQRCIDAFGTAGNGGDVMVAQCEHYTYDAHVIEFMVLLSY